MINYFFSKKNIKKIKLFLVSEFLEKYLLIAFISSFYAIIFL